MSDNIYKWSGTTATKEGMIKYLFQCIPSPPESVEIELTDKGRKIRMFEVSLEDSRQLAFIDNNNRVAYIVPCNDIVVVWVTDHVECCLYEADTNTTAHCSATDRPT